MKFHGGMKDGTFYSGLELVWMDAAQMTIDAVQIRIRCSPFRNVIS